MATADRELSIVIKAVIDGLLTPVKQAESAIKNFAENSVQEIDSIEGRVENLTHTWRSMLEAFIGVEIYRGMLELAKAADDATRALLLAQNATKNLSGTAFPVAQAQEWAQSLAMSTQGGGVTADQIGDALERFALIGATFPQQQRLVRDAIALSAATGKDFERVYNSMALAATGYGRSLEQLGVQTRDAQGHLLSFAQIMTNVERTSSQAAEIASTGLPGALGREATAWEDLRNTVGGGVLPVVTGLLNAVTRILDAINSLNPRVVQAAAGFVGFVASAAATALLLPAIAKGVAVIGDGFALMGTLVGVVTGGLQKVTLVAAATDDVLAALADGMISTEEAENLLTASTTRSVGVFGLLRTLLVGPVVAAFEGLISYARTAATALVAAAGAEDTFIGGMIAAVAPIAAVVAAIAGLIAAVVVLTGHWKDAMNFLSRAWDEFYNNILRKADNLKRILGDIAAVVANPIDVSARANLAVDLASMLPETSKTITGALKSGTDYLVGQLKNAWNAVTGFFSAAAGKPPATPSADLSTLGQPAKAGKDQSAAHAENALKNFTSAIDKWLESFQARVDAAQAVLDASKAGLDAFKAALADGKPQNDQQAAQYQALLRAELQAQNSLRAATLEKQMAEVEAAAKYAQIAKSVSRELKNHDALVRSATDAARQHGEEAAKLWTTYQNIAVTLAQIRAEQRDIKDQTAEAEGDTRAQQARLALDAQLNANAAQVEALNYRHAIAQERSGGQLSKTQEAAYAVELAQLALAAAVDREQFARHAASIADDTARITGSIGDRNKAIDAHNQETAATNERIAADHRLLEAQDAYTRALQQHTSALSKALDDLVKKLNVPGLQQSATGGFTFSPIPFLIEAFSQTKAFGDVMGFVNQIIKVFAQLLDNLRPILDVIITVLRSVANVFIFLYNTVARILRLFGIHLQLLSEINGAYQNQIPLIEITHSIPTLNELASGKLNNPLSSTPIDSNSLQNIGTAQVSLLQSILGAVLTLVAIESIFGHGGGIFGMLDLFRHGASAAAAAGSSPLQQAYNALQTLPTDSVAQGTQQALAADGSSTSGGLFTATNNALQSAAPYLASAIGTVLGSALGGGGSTSTLLGGIGSIVGTIFGGPVGGAIGGFVGGILGGLFGHHHSSATKQTSEFTAMLRWASDVHAWMNELTSPLAANLRSLQSASSALTDVAATLGKAASTFNANMNFSHTTNIDRVHIHDDRDVAELSRDLANNQMRAIRTFQFGISRAPIG